MKALVLAFILVGCGASLSPNEKTMLVTSATFSAASSTFIAWDLKHQNEILSKCDPNPVMKIECDANLRAYRAKRDKVVTVLVDSGKAIDAGWVAITDKSVATAVAAAATVAQALTALGVK